MARRRERGFAAMSPEEQRAIASKGGRAAHERGTAHQFDSEEAREAGRRGGKAVSRNRAHMAEIGRKGGKAARHRNAAIGSETVGQAHHLAAPQRGEAGEAESEDRPRNARTKRSAAEYEGRRKEGGRAVGRETCGNP
jgi:general stress protein YciG